MTFKRRLTKAYKNIRSALLELVILPFIVSLMSIVYGFLIGLAKELIPNFIKSAVEKIVPPLVGAAIWPLIGLIGFGTLGWYRMGRDLKYRVNINSETNTLHPDYNVMTKDESHSYEERLKDHNSEYIKIWLPSFVGAGATLATAAVAAPALLTGSYTTGFVFAIGQLMGASAPKALTYAYVKYNGKSNENEKSNSMSGVSKLSSKALHAPQFSV